MIDNGVPFVTWLRGVLSGLRVTLEEMRTRPLRTQVNSPWSNDKIERF